MKELTAAQGLLRCGECDTIFDAMKSLSTTLSEDSNQPQRTLPNNQQSAALGSKIPFWQRWFKRSEAQYPAHSTRRQASSTFLFISILALSLLLAIQVLYSARHWLAQQPMVGAWVNSTCQVIGCEINNQQDTSAIRILSRSVFSHPNSPDVLIIKASMQNEANFPQRYPIVEISFLNKASEIIALRRFQPKEYLAQIEQSGQLMPTQKPKELSVNVKDPGTEAVRYHFRLL